MVNNVEYFLKLLRFIIVACLLLLAFAGVLHWLFMAVENKLLLAIIGNCLVLFVVVFGVFFYKERKQP